MIGSYDMLPRSCRELVLKRSRIRRWIMAYGVVLGVVATGYVLLNVGRDGQVQYRDDLRAQVRMNWDRNEEAQRLFKEIQDLSNAIARYNRLAWPIRVSDTIAIIEPLVPESATLTSLTLAPRTQRIRGTSGRDGKRQPDEVLHFLALEIEGIAIDDMAVARIVSGLDEHPIFASVTLDFARSIVVDGTPGREFRINCEIDLGQRYAFVGSGTDYEAAEVSP